MVIIDWPKCHWPEFPWNCPHSQSCRNGEDYDTICWVTTLVLGQHLANVAVRANYRMCLLGIAPRLIKEMTALPKLWEAIAEEPRWWIGFAVLLLADDIFAECLRQIVGSSCLSCQPLPDCLGLDRKD
jgi:hypothetical protein